MNRARWQKTSRAVVPVLSVLMVLCLAGGWLLSGVLVGEAPPLIVAAGRTGASFLAITAVVAVRPTQWFALRVVLSRKKSVWLLAFLGFFAYYIGTLMGLARIGTSTVGLIVSLLPCLTFAIGVAAFGERATVRKVLGTVLAVAAVVVYLASRPAATFGAGGTARFLAGAVLAIAGTTAYALYGYVYRQGMADTSPVAALPAITGAGTLMLGVASLLSAPFGSVDGAPWAGIAVLGAGLTAPVFLISHELILRKGPLFTSSVALIVPFLIRVGEWLLGSAGPPGPASVALLGVACGGIRLTVSTPRGRRPRSRRRVVSAGVPKGEAS